ncbi:hypothetical protein FO488_15815 [Geobacter sp. FeAm09]|uniref:hypothetical protein n=1 Tax=Geobacter sp. FeAm09 TaxID=2597769 RepID=UPI0011ECF121|nr:hypothetical protein [Geobacter sp. FeAm09]QEM69476.1 hypothetical protein FO488_15815 [Geobacter sp. FeAm09]
MKQFCVVNKICTVLYCVMFVFTFKAMPAFAFENEFHGSYTLKYFVTNYEQASSGYILSGATPSLPSGNSTKNLRANNYFEQRARLHYTAKASDDLKLVTAFEIDSAWGDKAQGSLTATNSSATSQTTTAAFRNSGGALESDAVNLETKWVYLDFKIPSIPTRVKAGIQPFKDSIKGIMFNFDGAGILASTTLGASAINTAYIRGYDESFFSAGTPISQANVRGNQNLDIGVAEFGYALNKDTKLGVVYYLYADGRPLYLSSTATTATDTSTQIHAVGLTGDAKVGPVALSGFAAYQGGVLRNINSAGDSAFLNAFAYNVAAKTQVGPGTLRTALLFTSGNDNNASTLKSKHLTGWVGVNQSLNATWSSTSINSYDESSMILLNRNALSTGTTTDYAIVYNIGNGTNTVNSQGLYLYTLGYDANITPKLFASANAGAAWAAHTNALKPTDKSNNMQNATNYIGTEINFEAKYKIYENLSAKVQAAYVFLGGYYKNSVKDTNNSATDPDNPYTTRLVLQYVF